MKLPMIFLCALLAFVHTASADNFEWAGGANSWTVLNNWLDLNNPDQSSPADYMAFNLPGTSDDVTIATGAVTLNTGVSIHSLSMNASLSIVGGADLFVNSGSPCSISEAIGSGGVGGVTQTAGSHTSFILVLGASSGSSGTYNLSGGTLNADNNDNSPSACIAEIIGYYGSGTFIQTGGTHNVGEQSILLAYGSGSTGSYSLSSGTLTSINSENAGYMGSAQFTQSGGSNSISGAGVLYIGQLSGSTGIYTLSGGYLFASAAEYVSGGPGMGTFAQSGGVNDANQLLIGLATNSVGNYNLSGGSLRVNTTEYIGYSGKGTFVQSGGTHSVAGSLTLAANQGSSGTYNILSGTAEVSGGVFINPNGTLIGSGTVSATVANGGVVSPGNIIGTLKINGSYAQSASGALNIVIGGTTAGSQYSQCTITGRASLNGTLDIVFTDGFTPQIGDQSTILTCQSLTGAFITLNGTTAVKGLTLVPIYSGTQVTLVATSPALTVVDANPLFLSSVQLPQPITQTLFYELANDSTTRTTAAADGITTLLLQFTNNLPGTVIFAQGGASGGTVSNVDGSQLPPSGVHTANINGQQMAFVLYTVPDTITPAQTIVTLQSSFTPDGSSTSIQQTPCTVNLIQTPVELVHGLWADERTWLDLQNMLSKNNIESHRADYYTGAHN